MLPNSVRPPKWERQGKGKKVKGKKKCPLVLPPHETIPTDPYSCSISPKISQWISFTCNLGSCQTAAFVLEFRANKVVHTPFKNGVSISYCFLALPYIIPFGFQSQRYGAHLPGAGPSGWGPTLGFSTLVHQGGPL